MITKLKELYTKWDTPLLRSLLFWALLHGFHYYVFQESMPTWVSLYVGVTMVYWFVTGLDMSSRLDNKMIEDIMKAGRDHAEAVMERGLENSNYWMDIALKIPERRWHRVSFYPPVDQKVIIYKDEYGNYTLLRNIIRWYPINNDCGDCQNLERCDCEFELEPTGYWMSLEETDELV